MFFYGCLSFLFLSHFPSVAALPTVTGCVSLRETQTKPAQSPSCRFSTAYLGLPSWRWLRHFCVLCGLLVWARVYCRGDLSLFSLFKRHEKRKELPWTWGVGVLSSIWKCVFIKPPKGGTWADTWVGTWAKSPGGI